MEGIPSVLACDVGNSRLRFAHVEGDTVSEVKSHRLGDLADLGRELAILWETMPEPKHVVAASVNPSGLRALEAAVHEAIGVDTLVVGKDTPLPLETTLDNPESIGVDRLCTAVAAFDRLGVPCIVADFGSAITIDAVDAEGRFMGGAILPGLRMGARTLHENTAQLPHVELVAPNWTFGQNTQEAIIGGLVYGAQGALRRLAEAYATQMGAWPLIIATGGDAELVCGNVQEGDLIQAIVPDLSIRGVAMAYYRSLLK
jgi:type III pantothenate kinase